MAQKKIKKRAQRAIKKNKRTVKKRNKQVAKIVPTKGRSYSKSKGTGAAPKRHSGRSLTGTVRPTKNPAYGGKKKGSGGNLAVRKKR